MNAEQLISAMIDNMSMDARTSDLNWDQCNALIAALEDGEALAAIGVTDDDEEAVEEAHAALVERRRAEIINAAPGYVSEVWGGWVWMIGSDEMSWSKRATREACEKVVEHVIYRDGIDRAFDIDNDNG